MDISGTLSGNEPALSPQTSVPAKVPVTEIRYHGKAGQIFRLHLLNVFLSVITLGIYSFWGKTRIRKYMTSHVSIQDDRFEYTGTGKELFYGWLKAVFIIILFMSGFSLLSSIFMQSGSIIVSLAFVALFYIAIFSIIPAIVYLALRYRLSRTRWRGIRFSLAGFIKSYVGLWLKRTFLNIVTLGWKIPKSDILLWSHIVNHMSYGDLKFSFKGDHLKLQRIHLITLAILIACVIASLTPLVAMGIRDGIKKHDLKRTEIERAIETSEKTASSGQVDTITPVEQTPVQNNKVTVPPEPEFEPEVAALGLLFYVGLGAGIFARLWYHAALWREKIRGLHLGNVRFKTDVTAGGIAKLFITNLLIIIFTLGLGKPIAMHRTLRYYVTHMLIGGDLKELVARQQALQQKSALGDALAADIGLDLGL